MSRGRYSRGTRGWKHELVNTATASVDPERDYLPFDGVTDFAYADGGATGYTTAYALIIKIATLPTTTAAWPVLVHLSRSASSFIANATDYLQLQDAAPDLHRHRGINLAAATNYERSSAGQCGGAQVQMLARDMTGNLARVRVIKASDQSVFWAPADVAAPEDSTPDDIFVGGLGNPNFTLNQAPCNIQLIAVVFLDAIPSDADLQLYADPDCHDARPIFGSSIKGYWCASSAVGSSIPALVGTAPLTLSGPTASDLVPLSSFTAGDDGGDMQITTVAEHGLTSGDPVTFSAGPGGVLPTGLVEGVTYYVDVGNVTRFWPHTLPGLASIIGYTDAGTAPMTWAAL